MNKNYQIFSESQPPKSEKAPRQRLTDNSRRIKEYSSSFDLSNPEDFRRFNVDPVTYVEQIKPNDLLSLRSLIHNLAQNITTPSQRQIGSANGFTRQTVSTHFGGLEAADVMGSHYNFKQNSSYCLNGIFYDKKIAFKLRFLLPELYLYVCFTLYNSKEYYTPLYVPNDSPDFDLFDQYPRNLNSCIPLFNVSVKKDRVSPHNYNLIRGGIYEEGDQKGDIENNSFSEQADSSVENPMEDCVCTTDPYASYDSEMIQRAHQTTAKALQDKEINYNDDEILEFYEALLVRLRDADKEKERISEARERELALEQDARVNSILESIINGGFLNTRDYAAHKTRQ